MNINENFKKSIKKQRIKIFFITNPGTERRHTNIAECNYKTLQSIPAMHEIVLGQNYPPNRPQILFP